MSVFNSVLPVITLVLGAALQQASTLFGTRQKSRSAARELYAEVPRFLWTKEVDGGFVELQVYLGRLDSAMQAAGVPVGFITENRKAIEAFWRATVEVPGEHDNRYVPDEIINNELTESQFTINTLLGEGWRERRRLLKGK